MARSAARSKTRAVQEPATKWQAYQAAVLARKDLTTDDKLGFIELARWADYETGANCAPTEQEMADRYGESLRWVARRIRKLKACGIIETIPLRTPRGRWNRNGYRFIGHGFESPAVFDNFTYLKPSRTPRRADRPRDRVTGRFACGPEVAIGHGPEVAIGAAHMWTASGQSDLAGTSDPAVDLSASAKAPVATLAEPETTPTPERRTAPTPELERKTTPTPELERKTTPALERETISETVAQWWMSQLNDERCTYAEGDMR
jgi:hypothetical protein